MKIIMNNCQGLQNCCLDLPPNSLVEFVGGNSNGKSTISRFLAHLQKCDLHIEEHRKTLIKRHEETANFGIVADNNEALILILHKEVSKSYLCFMPDFDDKSRTVTRGLNDREGCKKLVHRFGFRFYANGEVSLNLAPTYSPIPLVNTSGKTNFEIVDDFSKDNVADEFMTSYKTYTRPMFVRKMKQLKERRAELERLTENNLYPDWEFCRDFAERTKELAAALTRIVPLDAIDYTRPIAYHAIEMNKINYRRPVANIYQHCEDMRTDLREVVEYNNSRCPNCGRQYLED